MGRYHCILRINESLNEEQINQLLLAHPYKLAIKKNNGGLTAFFVVDNQVIRQELDPKDMQELANEIPEQANRESYNRALIEKLENILKIPDLPETDKLPQFRGGWEKLEDYIENKLGMESDLVGYLTLDKAVNSYQDEFGFLCKLCDFLLRFNYKNLSEEYKTKNRLPDNIDGVVDKLITIILNFVDKDPNLLTKAKVSMRIIRKILEKTSETNPELCDKISLLYLPTILKDRDNQSKFALKFHTFNHERVEKEKAESLELPLECIYAHQGALPDPDNRMEQVQGHLFKIEKDFDLGYTLFLPRNYAQPRAIIIWVYGGNTPNQPNFLIGKLADIDLYLLKEGIAVSYLNTPERKLYPSVTVNQLEATQRGQAAVTETISCFVKQIRENPSALHEKCGVLKDIPIFLIGFSFGGGTVLRYKQICDNPDISGFISVNGALSLEKIKLHERAIMSERWTNPAKQAISWLSPERIISKKEEVKPALIVQNIKDTNSNIYNAISFFNKAIKEQLAELKIFLFDDDTNVAHDNFDHEIPRRGNHSFLKLAHAICDFILKGDFNKNDSLSIEEAKIKMAIYSYNKNMNMRFVSYVYCYYPNDFEQAAKINTDNYEPILAAIYYVNQLFKRNDGTLKTTVEADVQRLSELVSCGECNEYFEKYLTLYLYFSISNSVLGCLNYDSIQEVVETVKNSQEALACFLTIYEDIDSILDNQNLHLLENLYICFPNLIPTEIYKQEDFLQFKQEALRKFSQVISKLEQVRRPPDTNLLISASI